jgi:hypothetical protein
MTERGPQLHATADGQITELISLMSSVDEGTLRLPCPGREKLGDGTIAAAARHTAENYRRMAGFVKTSDQMSGAPSPSQHGAHRTPRFLRAFGHGPADHGEHGPDPGRHEDRYSADGIDSDVVIEQLSAARETLARIADLSDSQLDAIPAKDSFRFCDGQRTLEQVLASLLRHQRHQLDVLTTANDRLTSTGQPNSPAT